VIRRAKTVRAVKVGGVSELRNIVILTGAGISAEPGIATFRPADGLREELRGGPGVTR
jgi:NAD-dependent SIR2 family protein deacetylase